AEMALPRDAGMWSHLCRISGVELPADSRRATKPAAARIGSGGDPGTLGGPGPSPHYLPGEPEAIRKGATSAGRRRRALTTRVRRARSARRWRPRRYRTPAKASRPRRSRLVTWSRCQPDLRTREAASRTAAARKRLDIPSIGGMCASTTTPDRQVRRAPDEVHHHQCGPDHRRGRLALPGLRRQGRGLWPSGNLTSCQGCHTKTMLTSACRALEPQGGFQPPRGRFQSAGSARLAPQLEHLL
ncbi:MAG: hypothetical protein QOH50_3477, partial [Kribbellaceae bacterium]|nr:hypothetical protein [Kribbellaceae bacterium]